MAEKIKNKRKNKPIKVIVGTLLLSTTLLTTNLNINTNSTLAYNPLITTEENNSIYGGYNFEYKGGTYGTSNGGRFASVVNKIAYADGKPVFCIDVTTPLGYNSVYSSAEMREGVIYNRHGDRITAEQLEKVQKIIFWGWDMAENKTTERYFYTQILIWQALGYNLLTLQDGFNYEGLNQLNEEINSHLTRTTSFNNKTYSMLPNSTLTITDTYGNLKYLNFTNQGGYTFTKDNNNLIITSGNTIENITAKSSNFRLGTGETTSLILTLENKQTLYEYNDPNYILATLKLNALTTPTPEKKVSDLDEKQVEHATLIDRGEKFTWSVKQSTNTTEELQGQKYINFTFKDRIIDELEIIQDEIKIINELTNTEIDKTNYTININGQNIEVSINQNYLRSQEFYGKTYRLDIPTRLKTGQNLKKYLVGGDIFTGKINIPNTGTVEINHTPKATNKVYITPPNPVHEIPLKKVSDLDEKQVEHATLRDRGEKHIWNVDQRANSLEELYQQKYESFIFYDTMVDELEIIQEEIKLKNKETGEEIDKNNYTININGQNIEVSINQNYLRSQEFYGKTYTLEIPTRLKKGQNLKKYLVGGDIFTGKINIPNTGTVEINHRPKATNRVYITPPNPVHEIPLKKVSDDDEKQVEHATLGKYGENHIWNVDQRANTLEELYQQKYESFIFYDTMVDELNIDKNTIKIINLTTNKEIDPNDYIITIDNQNIKVEIKKQLLDKDEFYGTTYRLLIGTKIKDGADLNKYIINNRIDVPNTGTVEINHRPKATNKVKVTPTITPNKDPEKKVSDLDEKQVEHATLGKYGEQFIWTIDQKANTLEELYKIKYTEFTYYDKVVKELEIIQDKIKLKNKETGEEIDKNNYTIETTKNNEVIAKIKKEYLESEEFYGKTYTLEIPTKIKDGANLNKYKKNNRIDIPNTAEVTINNEKKITNKVKVTPTITPNKDPEKKVSDLDAKEVEHALLNTEDEKHIWNIDQYINTLDALYHIKHKDVTFIDEIVDELEIIKDEIKLKNKETGEEINKENYELEIIGQTVVVKIKKQYLASQEFYGKTYTLEIPTKIKDGADLTKYKKENGNVEIPNTAKVVIDGKIKTTNEVKVTPPKKKLPKTAIANIEQNNTITTSLLTILLTIFIYLKRKMTIK